MPARLDDSPNKAEIADQLGRMLASDIFVLRPRQAKVFEFLVMNALIDKDVTEKAIRAEFFPSPPYQKFSTIARTTVNFIRDKLLPSYYAGKSKDDLVIITLSGHSANESTRGKRLKLPAGQAYRPVFRYNPDHFDIKAYRYARHCIDRKCPAVVELGSEMLRDVIRRQPRLASAYVALAESGCLASAWARALDGSFFASTGEIAQRGSQLNPADWHAVAVYATCCLFQRNSAYSFAALKLATLRDWHRTRNYIGYQIYFFLSGKTEEAVALMQITAEEQFNDAYLYAVFGLFLYMMREFDAARDQVMIALFLDHNCWLAHLVLALVQLSCDDAPDAYTSLMHVQRCIDAPNDALLFPGVAAVAATVAKGLTQDERESLIDKVLHYELISFNQLALCLMADNRPDEALDAIESALLRYEPPTLFLRFLPIFDPLRKHERFQAFLECLPDVVPFLNDDEK
jgi:tetratricopeptide (TPR) repeat protein